MNAKKSLSILLFLTAALNLSAGETGSVSGKFCNIRATPSTSGKMVGKANKNDEFEILQTTNQTDDKKTWYQVRFKKDGSEGWVASWLVKVAGANATTESVTTVPAVKSAENEVAVAVVDPVEPESKVKPAVAVAPEKPKSNSAEIAVTPKPTPTPTGGKGGKTAEEFFNDGIDYLVKGLYDKALEVNLKAYELKPDDIQIMNNLANSYYRTGKVEEAIKIWKESLRYEENTDVANNLGIVYFNQENYTESKTYYEKAIQIDDHNAEAFFNLASLYGIMRNYEKAIDHFNKFKDLSKDKELLAETEKRITFCQKQVKPGTVTAAKPNK